MHYEFSIHYGGLAQLARALAWHARGHRFDPDILHSSVQKTQIILKTQTTLNESERDL